MVSYGHCHWPRGVANRTQRNSQQSTVRQYSVSSLWLIFRVRRSETIMGYSES